MAIDTHRIAITIKSAHYVSVRSQLIRAAISVPANIVEGSGQRSALDFSRFLGYSLNSAVELEYHCLIARDIGVIKTPDDESVTGQLSEIQKMLHGLIKRLRESPKDKNPHE